MDNAKIIFRNDETLTDDKGRLVGWIADDGKFHPSSAPRSAEQLREILAMLSQVG